MVAIAHPHRTTRPHTIASRHRRPAPPLAVVYRRRRLAALVLALLLVLSLVSLAGRLTAGTGDGSLDGARAVAERSVVVAPGDTVWSIASAMAGDGDVRPVVDAIVEANGGADLVVGQRLVVAVP